MASESMIAPDGTAVRTALWRGLHLLVDAAPPVFEDEIGLRIAAPEDGWRERPDMDPDMTSVMRAGILSRARFVEDLLTERIGTLDQFVLLGAGLDTFVQRRPELATRVTVFEIDQPGPQEWKRRRLDELGFGVPDGLRLVPVDFEVDSWWERLLAAGFDPDRPALVASTGVSMYLTREANIATLHQLSRLAPGSALAMTFMVPMDLVGPGEQRIRGFAEQGARTSGTPFISFFRPDEIVELAESAGLRTATHISPTELTRRYFADRSDGLRPAESEQILLATT